MSALTVILPPNSAPKPIAPKMAKKTNTNELPSSTTSSQQPRPVKRKMMAAFHPTLGYAIPPPQPAKVARRNQRERNRVKQVNCGFEVLRTHIPTAAKQKKMSKVDTLKHAVEYIQTLQCMLTDQENHGISTSSLGDESISSPGASSIKEEHSPFDESEPSSPTGAVSPVPSSAPPPPPLSLMPAPSSQYNPPEHLGSYPLTPRTPNTDGGMYPQQQQHFPSSASTASSMADSGYDTASGYYSSSASSGLISPQGHQGHAMQHHMQYQSPQANANANYHQSSPSPTVPQQQYNPHHVPASYYEHSEEDELLDAIAHWQDTKE